MKILMLHERYKLKGGEDESTAAELKMLRERGHDVDFVELNHDSIPETGNLQTGLSAVWSTRGYDTVRARLSSGSFDVMHVQNFFPLWSPSVYYAAAKSRTATVQSVRNYRLFCPAATLFRDDHHCVACVGKKIPWPGVAYGCYRESRPATAAVAAMIGTHWALGTWSKAVDRYIALTGYVRRQMIDAGFPADKISTKPNFLYDPVTESSGAKAGDYFLYVGRLTREKGLPVLFEAWAKSKSVNRLMLVGAGAIPDGLQVPENVDVLGVKPIDQTYALIAGAKALILPAIWAEPFGRVVIEAFALGTPVISSASGALTELIEHEKTGLLVPPGDSNSLAAAIDRVASDDQLRVALSHEARKKYLENYTAAANYEQLIEVYHRAIETAVRRYSGGSKSV